jgi:periplasmic protein TonB
MDSDVWSKAFLGHEGGKRQYTGPLCRASAETARSFGGQGRGQRIAALALAGAVQIGAAYLLLATPALQKPPGQHTVEVTVLEPPKPPIEPPPALPIPVLPQPQIVVPTPPVIRIEQPKAAAPAAPAPAPSPPAPPVVAAPPPPPPAQAPGVEDAFKAAVRAAVFEAYRVPSMSRLLGQYGATRVQFVLQDGRVSAVRILASSGHEPIDQAALAAVQTAQYPDAPEALRGRPLTFEIVLYTRRAQ